MNDDPCTPSETTQIISKNLPALAAIELALDESEFHHPEMLICAGLIHALVDLVLSDTVPGSQMHEDAKAILEEIT